MTTLYIRDVDPDIAETLKDRAAAAGQSLSAYVGHELCQLASRPTNAEVAARLRKRDRAQAPTRDDILQALEATRK